MGITVTNVHNGMKKENNIAGGFGRGVEMVNGVVVRDLNDYDTKDKLEEYGKKFGIDLKKNFSLENMRKQLQEHIDSLR